VILSLIIRLLLSLLSYISGTDCLGEELLLTVMALETLTGYTMSRPPTSQSGRRPISLGRGLCASHGAWKLLVRWNRTQSSARSVLCSRPTRAAMSSRSGTCWSVRTATSGQTRSFSGRWKSASCRGCRSMASDSSASRAHQLDSRTLPLRSPTSWNCETAQLTLCYVFHFYCGITGGCLPVCGKYSYSR